MHIILGILGLVVSILVLLNRLQQGGIDIGWLNPFSWHRRRQFRKQYELSAAYSLESPMDVAALFMVAVAKVDGDMSKEQKGRIIELFQSEFKLSDRESTALLGASVHIYGRGDEVINNPKTVLARSIDDFSSEQSISVKHMLNEVAKVEGDPTTEQVKLIKAISAELPTSDASKW